MKTTIETELDAVAAERDKLKAALAEGFRSDYQSLADMRADLDAARRENAVLRDALKPFAACRRVIRFAAIQPADTWLWKPQQTSRDLPGINVAHIDAAKSAFSTPDTSGYVKADVLREAREALDEIDKTTTGSMSMIHIQTTARAALACVDAALKGDTK